MPFNSVPDSWLSGKKFELMISKYVLWTVAASFLLAPAPGAAAQGPQRDPPKPAGFVSSIFGDNMVLQRGKPNTIWGWSDSGDTVRVQIGDNTASGVAGPDRRWQLKIQPPAAGGPYTVKITGHQTVELQNVMVGDVWLCAGQSNMQFGLRQARTGPEDVKTANNPEIRFFTVGEHAAYHHTDVPQGSWKVVSPETADRISAVAYYFAREVQKETHIPIGLVVDAVGGTPAESWTSAAALQKLKDFEPPLAELQRVINAGGPEYGNYVMSWYDQYDIGLKGNWAAPGVDASDWKPVTIPGGFAELGVPDAPALVWFRKEITLPDPLPTGRATLSLGIVEKMDTAYVNGVQVGGSSWVENPRNYFIRPGVLKPGKNVITIRVFKTLPDGGFMSKPDDLHLVLGDQTLIPLAGKWQGKVSVDARPPHPLPIGYQNWPVMPSVLYEGMVAPLVPLAITGALWYQGEENSERAYEYRKILPAMIADWRSAFGQGNFPFYVVSLPGYKPRSATPTEDVWAETRESQAVTVATVPNTCLAVTIDTGDADNIHGKDKIPVGDRLARCALANYYGKKVVFEGPTIKSVERLPNSIRLHFTHTEGGLVNRGDKLEFTIAGDDRKWVWADARIEGDTIVVSSPSVPNPREVRYAWQSNPSATLFNGAGLPAAPFRTDKWPGITDSRRPY
jgi:sialate O-acetylesterase